MSNDHEHREDLNTLSEVIGGLADFVQQQGSPEEGAVYTVTSLVVDLPLEVSVQTESGRASRLQVATPLRTWTSFNPSLNDLRLRIEIDDAG